MTLVCIFFFFFFFFIGRRDTLYVPEVQERVVCIEMTGPAIESWGRFPRDTEKLGSRVLVVRVLVIRVLVIRVLVVRVLVV